MREESPQRESPTNNTRNNFPSGNIATAEYYGTGTSPQVAVVLSPTMQMYGEERMRSPSREAVSPTRTSPMMASSPLTPVAVVRKIPTSNLIKNVLNFLQGTKSLRLRYVAENVAQREYGVRFIAEMFVAD